MSKRRNGIHAQQWFWRSPEMLLSPAWRELSLSARRLLDRLSIEFMAHAGKDNGRLPVTYEQFVEYGIDRHAIAPAIRETEALGFIEVTQRGKPSPGELRFPNYFRLTDRKTKAGDPTDDWKRIKTKEDAHIVARAARRAGQKSIPQCGKPPLVPMGKNPHWGRHFSSGENPHYCRGGKTPTTSISR
jgi:hypothetical protein